jgi:glutamate synthase (ferredoxin)
VMARQCHLNTCPVGIASQRPELRARYGGTPEMLISYLRLVAQDVREILAGLGLRTLSDLVGRRDLLERREDADHTLDLSPLLRTPAPGPVIGASRPATSDVSDLRSALARAADGRLGHQPVNFIGTIHNTDRAIGSDLAGRLAGISGDTGTAHAPLEVRLTGSAGQSLWAFALPGMHVRVDGDANDGVGKGMHGGEIVIRPPAGRFVESPVLVGNAALYGATGGRMFVAGRVGERFAVRNSGAWAVVEGVGDHACEYMTGGAVLVLGRTGRNFAAGMTGGVAYILDDADGTAAARIHAGSVRLQRGLGVEEPWVRAWLGEHHERTGSAVAAGLLRRWASAREQFWVVIPQVEAGAAAEPLDEAFQAVELTSAGRFA